MGRITIPPLFREWAIKQLKEEHSQEIVSREEVTRAYHLKLDAVSRRLDTLLNMRLNDEVSVDQYAVKKEELLKEKQKYEELISDTQGRIETWMQRAEETFSFAETAQSRFKNGTLEDKRQILSCLGSNLILKDRKLQISVEKRFALFQEVTPKLKSLQNRLEPVGFIGKMEASTGQTKFWGDFQASVITYFAQHPEETL